MVIQAPIRRILIGINMTPASRYAFYQGIELATQHGAEAYVLHVSEPIRSFDFAKKRYVETKETIERIEEGVRQRVDALWEEGGVDAVDRRKIHIVVRGGKAAEELVASAIAKQADLIVIGIGGENVAGRVVRTAPCSVYCVMPPKETGPVL